MIKVTGMASLRVRYMVEVNVTEEQWEQMNESSQNDFLESVIDWKDACRSAEIDEMDVWDIEEVSNG